MHWKQNCLFNYLFRLTTKKNSCLTGPFWGSSLTKGPECEKLFHIIMHCIGDITTQLLLPPIHISKAKYKTAVTPLLMHWNYCSLALTHGYDIPNPALDHFSFIPPYCNSLYYNIILASLAGEFRAADTRNLWHSVTFWVRFCHALLWSWKCFQWEKLKANY